MKKIHTSILIILFAISSQLLLAGTNLTCTANATSSSNLICIGQGVTLSGTISGLGMGGASYTWLPLGTSGQYITVYPTTSTTYTVQVKSGADTCYAVTTVSVSSCAGTEEFTSSKFSIFPNPAITEINIIQNFNLPKGYLEIKLINELGELVYLGHEQKIDVSNLPRGIYLVMAKDETNIQIITYKKILLI